MYLQSLRLQNIVCFDEIILNFSTNSQPCQWVVILGENGTGKSTLLQMMALALLGRDRVAQVSRNTQWERFVTRSDRPMKGEIDLTLAVHPNDKKQAKKPSAYQTRFQLGRTTSLQWANDIRQPASQTLSNSLYSDDLTCGWFACGYGPWRRLPQTSKGDFTVDTTDNRKAYRFATMFEAEIALTQVNGWLAGLEFSRLKGNKQAEQTLQLAINALEKILPEVTFQQITEQREIIFLEHGRPVSLDQFSDGYRSTTAWVGDLVRRLVEAFPNKKNPLSEKGVVLVDELALHLHPRWQREIVTNIRELFPNMQFIVTSHSPFVAQDMRPEDKIIVLKKEGGLVRAEESTGFAKSWRADQILTSLFGLSSTRDVVFATNEQEYQDLLTLQTENRLSPKNQRRLSELKDWLKNNQAPPGETVEENDLFEAATALSDMLDDYLTP